MADYKETKRYRVAIVETLRRVVTVEAEDENDAHQRISDAWHNADYILTADDFDGAEFHVLDEAENSDGEEADKK